MGGEIKRSGFARGIGCSLIYESLEIAGEGKRVSFPPAAKEEESTCTSSSTSSIGRNSESFGSDGEDLAGEKAVESPYKGPLGALESLEVALPVRRGISNFYNGKSKSFASLSDVMVSCAFRQGPRQAGECLHSKKKEPACIEDFLSKVIVHSIEK